MAQIHELIGKAMADIGAIGKTSKNQQQGFMYRGIDAVYNALNPVMAKHGLFITPEVLDMKREERVNNKGTTIIYTMLTIKFTVYAPDGSNVSCTVVGEAMDTGDKSVNKAMSIAMKYCMFQLFFIPTEELKDPDAEVYTDIKPKEAPAHVTVAKTLPEQKGDPQVRKFFANCMTALRDKRGISVEENKKLFMAQYETLKKAKLVPDKELAEYDMTEASNLVNAMQKCFELTGTELIIE